MSNTFDILKFLVINPNIPVNNIKEFIDYAKKNPSLISYGSAGAGSADHLCAELFKLQTNTQGIHVPYKGGSAVQTEIMAGVISLVHFKTLVL